MRETDWNANELLSPRALLADLDDNARPLFAQVRKLDGGLSLLRLLHSKANTVLTVDDLAYHLNQAAPVVERTLRRLVELGWARQIDLKDCSWFGLTTDPQRRQLVAELVTWQDGWNARLEQMRHTINGAMVPI